MSLAEKTFWPHQISSADQKCYSGIVGVIGAVFLVISCGVIPVLIAFFILEPWRVNEIKDFIKWSILIPYIPLFFGVRKFVKSKKEASKSMRLGIMTSYSSNYLTLFFLEIIIISFF